MNLEGLGYNPEFEEGRNRLGLGGFPVARVTAEFKGAYSVRNAGGEYLARVTGKQMFEAASREDYPAVGDWVAIAETGNGEAVIRGILPRQSVIKRKSGDRSRLDEKGKVQVIAANVDVAFVVESLDRDYSLNRFERYFAIAEQGGVRPAIILNKADLASPAELDGRLRELADRFPGVEAVATSAASGEGADKLREHIVPGKTYCFLGSSGVGKSSLINKLLGGDAMKTGEISSYSGRGRHTTTNRQMHFLASGGIMIDNPGMREIGLAGASQGVGSFFGDITALSRGCQYADCTHMHEPGCEVLRAVEAGELGREQYANYLSLRKEAAYGEMDDLEKREKDRQFGKMIKGVKKDLKKFGPKWQ